MGLREICGSRVWRVAAFSVLVSLPVQLQAQTPSLAEVARKEQARRKAAGPPGKVYTNKDLPKTAVPAAAAPVPLPPPAAEPSAEAAPQKQVEEQKDEAWWRARLAGLREERRRNEMFLEALQSRVNALATDFVNRDDPFQRAQIGQERQSALAEMDRVKADVERLKQDIENLEEDARKAGVPPGWLR